MGVDDSSQPMFGCLWRVLCDSCALDANANHTSAKSVHWPSSCVHIVVVLRQHVGVGGAGTRAHVICCIVQAEARGLYDVTTNARASGSLHARCALHVDLAGPWPFGASRVVFPSHPPCEVMTSRSRTEENG